MADCCDKVVTIATPTIDLTVIANPSTSVVQSTDTTTAVIETKTTAVVQEPQVTIIELGTSISTGTGGDTNVIYLPFTFGSASPQVLGSLNTNDIVMNCEVVINTAFNDAAAQLNVGTPATQEAVMASTDIAPSYAFPYGTDDNYIAPTTETLNLYIASGSSTMGSGYILLLIRRTS